MYKKNKKFGYHRSSKRPGDYEAAADAILKIFSRKTGVKTTPNVEGKYSLKPSLLTPAESKFSKALEQAVGDHYQIALQVQLSRLMNVNDSNSNFTNYADFNRIAEKSIDFVLYDEKFEPYLAIELDDRTHSRPDRIKRDVLVNQIMADVGLRIIHIPVAYSYDIEDLRRQIFMDE